MAAALWGTSEAPGRGLVLLLCLVTAFSTVVAPRRSVFRAWALLFAVWVGTVAAHAIRAETWPDFVLRRAIHLLPLAYVAPWSSRTWERVVLSLATIWVGVQLGLGLAGITSLELGWMGSATAGALLIAGVGRRRIRNARRLPGLLDTLLLRPSRFLVASFGLICVVGGGLLSLPLAASESALAPLDALFMAVSATCVTGLIVVDTPTALSFFGQLIVLLLIQVGGLGIMVFSAAALVFLGRRMSLSHERAAVDLVGAQGRHSLRTALGWVLGVTVATEAATALLLFLAFLQKGDALGTAAWRATFTAVSAFCNAGFALQSDSLIPYARDPHILAILALTIVVSGLGPAVVAALVSWKDPTRRSLHVKLVLVTTLVLLVVPTLCIALFEWNHSLAGLSVPDKLMNAMFQSVTLRTAGFNSVDLTRIQPATWSVMLVTMFVGGSPGSTAGGVKTTTIAVVFMSILTVVQGRKRVEIFGRTLPMGTVLRSLAVTGLALFGALFALMSLQLTQNMPLDVALFEVVSALATVGLSTGGTAMIDEAGKVVIMVCMFVGRVGPLTLFLFLSSRSDFEPPERYAEEPVPIG